MDRLELTKDKLKDNLATQLAELDILISMYCNPGEIKIEDVNALNDIKQFVSGNDGTPPYLNITINVIVDSSKFEICVNLPHEYPDKEPDMFVRNHKLNRYQHTQLNKDITEYLLKFKGDTCVFTAISWLQDNASNYVDAENKDVGSIEKKKKLVRFWIYSHHIYSKTKRREILNLANELNITGFCMPGKPGIICIEGTENDCSEWWHTVRSMTWKRILCKITEDCKDNDNHTFLKFNTFEEISFPNNGVRGNHMNMGEFLKFLDIHGCSYIFKELFGVDVKNNS